MDSNTAWSRPREMEDRRGAPSSSSGSSADGATDVVRRVRHTSETRQTHVRDTCDTRLPAGPSYSRSLWPYSTSLLPL